MNPTLKGQAELIQHVIYSQNGQELTLILPWAPQDDRSKVPPVPLILFVQGSSWTTPNLGYEIPMLSHFAEEGIAVATVSHRSANDGYPFPAFLLDVKCAIRFLRAHAADYAIDPDRIVAFGTSSGGNTVCLLGLTGDEPALKTEEYADQSDAVCAVASCFAPTDLPALFAYLKDVPNMNAVMTAYFGQDSEAWDQVMRTWSPVYRVQQGKEYPPFLLLHGTGDPVVPCQQMDSLYTKLKEAKTDVAAYYVDGAEHEGNFWSPIVRKVIQEWIRSILKSVDSK
ncbi:MAG: alpha/beta hydrolase [Clostridia bacterium]|nr:alpha/beta hydrolase [Clostridia bacterium]